MSAAPISARTALLMTLPPLLWAANAVVGRLLVGHVPPLTLNFVRWLLAALILAPLGWRPLRDLRAMARAWPYLLAIGCLGVGAYNALQYLALTTSTPLNVTLIAASTPLWMLAIGALWFDQRRPRDQRVGPRRGRRGSSFPARDTSWSRRCAGRFTVGCWRGRRPRCTHRRATRCRPGAGPASCWCRRCSACSRPAPPRRARRH